MMIVVWHGSGMLPLAALLSMDAIQESRHFKLELNGPSLRV